MNTKAKARIGGNILSMSRMSPSLCRTPRSKVCMLNLESRLSMWSFVQSNKLVEDESTLNKDNEITPQSSKTYECQIYSLVRYFCFLNLGLVERSWYPFFYALTLNIPISFLYTRYYPHDLCGYLSLVHLLCGNLSMHLVYIG